MGCGRSTRPKQPELHILLTDHTPVVKVVVITECYNKAKPGRGEDSLDTCAADERSPAEVQMQQGLTLHLPRPGFLRSRAASIHGDNRARIMRFASSQ